MVGSAGWRWCNVLALVTPAASSARPQHEEQTKGGVVPLPDCTATDCYTSVGFSSTRPRPSARPAETVVNASLAVGSTLAVRPEHSTHSNITSSNARSAQEDTVRPASTSSSGASLLEQDSFHLRSRETLLAPVGVVERNSEESMGNGRFVVNGASSNNSWLDSCATDDNPVPYSRSNSNSNTSAVQNNLEKCTRLNQDTSPWFSHYGEDNYDHVTRGLIYIETSIPGPGLDMDTFQQMPHGCNCQEDCSKGNGRGTKSSSNADANVNRSDDASDISKLVRMKSKIVVNRNCYFGEGREKPTVLNSGRETVSQNSRYSQDAVTVSCDCSCSDRTPASYRNGLLVQPNLPWPIYECNDDCHCQSLTSPRSTSNGCQNRVVQRGPRRDLVIRKAKGNRKRYLVNGCVESSLVCDSQLSQNNDQCDVSMDSWKNLCGVLSDNPDSKKLQPRPLASCQSGGTASSSLIDQIHPSDPREVSVPESVNSANFPDKGLGVFTKLFIPRGSFICEYAGELLGEEEARCRFARQEREGKSNYILVLREFYGEEDTGPTNASTGTERGTPKYSSSNHSLKYSQSDTIGQYCDVTIPNWRFSKNASMNETATKQDSDFLKEVKKPDICISSVQKPAQITIIDPTSVGNIGRYLNHSCDPNTHVVPVRVNSVIPVAAMFALRDVLPGEELVYDYGSGREAAALYWTNGQPTNAAGDVGGLGSMSDNVGDCCHFGTDPSTSSVSETRALLEMSGANAALHAIHSSLDAEEMTVGLRKRRLKHDSCWGQHRATEKKQRLNFGSVETEAMGSKTSKIKCETPMAIVYFDGTKNSPCLCGARNCRGYLPAEVDLF